MFEGPVINLPPNSRGPVELPFTWGSGSSAEPTHIVGRHEIGSLKSLLSWQVSAQGLLLDSWGHLPVLALWPSLGSFKTSRGNSLSSTWTESDIKECQESDYPTPLLIWDNLVFRFTEREGIPWGMYASRWESWEPSQILLTPALPPRL